MPVRLDWQAPDGCPTAEQVRARITTRLRPSLQTETTLEVTARATEASGQWRLDMDVKDARGTGHRTLHADSCEALADAAVLVVAITLNPPQFKPVEVAPTPVVDVKPSTASTVASWSRHWSLRGSVTADIATWPLILWGGSLHGALDWGPLRIELGAGSFGQRRFSDGPRQDSSVDVAMPLFAGAKACFLPLTGNAQLGLCGGAEVGWVTATGNGVSQPRSGNSLWWALEAGVTARFLLWGPFHFHVGAMGAYSPLQTSIFFDGFGEVARSRALTFRPELGLELVWQ
ncbi:MAG: hypothetical protein K1X64_10975 [Myxococcaceae bacterium]|nr:hypothetical protein [Myxococcaceae bacterium]